jgi:hypothetical protein
MISAGAFNTFFGAQIAGSLTIGQADVAIGLQDLSSCVGCSGVTALGFKAGQGIVNGTNDLILQATNGADACSNGDESNVIAVCAGAGRVWTTTGTGSPSSSKTVLAGTAGTGGHTIAGLPTCNSGMAGQFDFVTNGVASPTYMGTVSTTGAANDPVFCNGSAWVYH